jgi:ABC-type methionine transport system ATPase subunit
MKLLNTRTLAENISFALEILRKKPNEIKDTTDYLLELVGLQDRRNLYPQQLSGGEQQRGAIARALASNPTLFVADEPTGNLDDENAYMILDILKKIHSSGTTVMVITHDNVLVNAKDNKAREIHLKGGEVISDTKEAQIEKKSHDDSDSIGEAMGDKEEKREDKMDPDLQKLSKRLVDKFRKNAIYSNDILLNLTESDLKQLKLKKKEEKELKKYIKNYLKDKKNVNKKKSK